MDTTLDLRWFCLPGSRPGRELSWLAAMPQTSVRAVAERPTGDEVPFDLRPYRRMTSRFVEAGALAWFRDLTSLEGRSGWVAALELCALVTGQAASFAARRGSRFAVLTWGNDPGNPLYRLPPYRQALARARAADLIVCFTEATLSHCLELGFAPERCSVVHPPVDTELFQPAEEPVEEPIAVFASPLAPNKGIDRVLDAFDLVRRDLPAARLDVVGGGPLEPLVRERAAASGGAIRLRGRTDRRGVADALREAAVFVTAPRPTPVWNEQFGMAYVEAMACGLPVVTTACGSNHEAVAAPNIRVADDVGELAGALATFLADPSHRAEVGRRNRTEVIDRFEAGQQLRRLRAAFDHPEPCSGS